MKKHIINRMNKQLGFSLVELAIVLVIIGLIVGGILTGQDLIRASEVNRVQAEVNKIKTAANTFRIKYNGLPGDIKNATSYWGNAQTGSTGGECAAPNTNQGSGTQTCNGNGNGLISSWVVSSVENHEIFRFWQHLANAGLYPGSYTGVAVTAATTQLNASIGGNIPEGPLAGSGFFIWNIGTHTSATSGDYFEGVWGNTIIFGARSGSSALFGPIFTPAEAYSLDAKYDDGLPGRGNVRGLEAGGTTPNCTTTNSVSTSAYDLADTSLACTQNFILN